MFAIYTDIAMDLLLDSNNSFICQMLILEHYHENIRDKSETVNVEILTEG